MYFKLISMNDIEWLTSGLFGLFCGGEFTYEERLHKQTDGRKQNT